MVKFRPNRQEASAGLAFVISLSHRILTGIKLRTVRSARNVTRVGNMKNMQTVLVGWKGSTVEVVYRVSHNVLRDY